MAGHTEKAFEDELCAHLAAHGWLYSPTDAGYDKARALYPDDVFGWLTDTQPDELAKHVTPGAVEPLATKQRNAVLDRLVKRLDAPVASGGGSLAVLRKGFAMTPAQFDMIRRRPETSLNPTAAADYDKVRVRVVRQVHFSTEDQRSIDLVLFVNGVPVATLELKTDFTQSIGHAIAQYKKDRLPRNPKTGHDEPLLGWGRRTLVHFAVSNDEVWMTTRLDGERTWFLPFNTGYDGGKGNPPGTDGRSATAYLWEQVLQRDAFLDVLSSFLHVEMVKKLNPQTGKTAVTPTLLFPRYHQWRGVTAVVAAARSEGPGHRYLIQHSAGSGKTSSIAWTAHRLARLHDDQDRKVFDTVLVVTDRTVLDDQLQEAIRQIDGGAGVVVTVDAKTVGGQGAGSKSGLLAQALLDRRQIIVVTIQTFPFAMDVIAQTSGLADRTFAVIADEAHSSQTGATANQLKRVLSTAELADLADGAEVSTEELLAAETQARAESRNISYVAFTATPKAKTLELFGRRDPAVPGSLPAPFDVYTMKQAIEEGYILDVLPGYQSYSTAFQIAQRVTASAAAPTDANPSGDVELVDQTAAVRGLMRWVKLHPTNIAQKVQIVVEHFRENVAHLLEGTAKAMVVTDSRTAAVRYKTAIDAYIAEQGYPISTLVAFSGSVDDPETGPEPFTESSMNPGVGADLRIAFQGDERRIMLVANKFQTGFDQPKLCAMYVDKKLSGVTAVQTLSRLNRVHRTSAGTVKGQPMVLDFVNDPEEIRKAFEPYYTDAYLETETDPDLVHDIVDKLDAAGIFDDAQVDAAADAWVSGAGNNALTAALAPAKQSFVTKWNGALVADGGKGDKAELDRLELFRKDVATFVRLYDFMSQVVDYGNVRLEKLSIFLRLLSRLIRPENRAVDVDLVEVALVEIKQIDKGKKDIGLGAKVGLHGMTGAGSGTSKDPKMVALAEIIDRLNELFGDTLSPAQKTSFVETQIATMLENETLVSQATVNSNDQFLESPQLKADILSTVADNQAATDKITDVMFSSGEQTDALTKMLGQYFFASVQALVAEQRVST